MDKSNGKKKPLIVNLNVIKKLAFKALLFESYKEM